jgi:hypothetical protein
MSSNFIVFPFRAVSGLFFSSPERQREKTRRNGAKGRTEAGGGWQGVRESAVRDKPLLVYGLARNRRGPKGPSEPRPSGVYPEEDEVKRRCGATVSGMFVVLGNYGGKTVGGIADGF